MTSLKSGFGCIFLNGTPVRALSWPELLEMRLAPTWLASLIREGLIDIRASDLYTYHPAARKSCICDLLLFFFFFSGFFGFCCPLFFGLCIGLYCSCHWMGQLGPFTLSVPFPLSLPQRGTMAPSGSRPCLLFTVGYTRRHC